MKNAIAGFFVLFCSVFFCLASLLHAADNVKPEQLTISIAVKDKSHNAVADLKPEEVSVTDNGTTVAPSSVVYAGSEPKDWILAIDVSGSMRSEPLWRPAIEAAVKQLSSFMQRRGDRVAVVTVQEEPYIDQALTSDEREVRAAVDRLPARGGTALYDGLSACARYLVQKRQQGRQQVIWMITDGGENASRLNLQETLDDISGTGVPILFSLIGHEARGINAVERLAKASGGSVFKFSNKNKCEEEATTLVAFADSEYVIAFSPASSAASHSIRVTTSRGGVELIDHDRRVVRGGSAR